MKPQPASGRPRLLVLCRHALGDIVLARPIFQNLRAWRPDAWIIAAAYPDQVPWLVLHPEVDQTLEIPRHSNSGRRSRGWLSLIRELRREPIELAHDMTQTERSSMVMLVSGARRRVGFAQADVKLRHRVYTDLMVWSEEGIAANHSRELYLEPLAAAGVPIVSRDVVVEVEPQEREAARTRIRALLPEGSGPLILVHPGASTANKCWPAEGFAAVCDELQESGAAQLLMLCGPRERDRVDAVRGRMRTEIAVIHGALAIRELAALMQQVDVFLGNDSGPMHLAAAVGTRVVGLFGGASPVQWGPLGDGHAVLRTEQPCRCPYRELCEPPNPYHMHCVRLLRREDVLGAVQQQIADLAGVPVTHMRLVLSSGTRTWGGLEQMCVQLALGLDARGHEVVLFCRRGSPVQQRLEHRIECEPILGHGRLNPVTLARCSRALRRHRPQAVIGNTTKDPSWTGFAARLMGIPFIYRHEFNRPYYDPPRTRLLFGWVPRVHIVNSQASRATVLASAPWLKPEQVRVIYNGIDVEQFGGAAAADLGLPQGAVVFGFVGRFEEQKGIFEIAEAWPRVVDALPHAHLVLVGWGQLEAETRAAVGDAPNVHWLGMRTDVPALMNAFDVLVAPFHQEGFGLVLVEAMAAGVPVVAARASSTPELVDNGVEGRLVPIRDPDALAREMIELGSDPALRACLGAKGRARASRDFTTDQMVQGHERLLQEIVSGVPVRRGGADAARLAGLGTPRTG